ncbi:hypothetical protein BDR07DRAFT_1374864 [Suillus spraguei]|nr:hypothetical protein BDR07DRAFT_1374864 [Suillus spraguei]
METAKVNKPKICESAEMSGSVLNQGMVPRTAVMVRCRNAREQWYKGAGADDDCNGIGKVAGVTKAWKLSERLPLGAGNASRLSGVSVRLLDHGNYRRGKVVVVQQQWQCALRGSENDNWWSISGSGAKCGVPLVREHRKSKSRVTSQLYSNGKKATVKKTVRKTVRKHEKRAMILCELPSDLASSVFCCLLLFLCAKALP